MAIIYGTDWDDSLAGSEENDTMLSGAGDDTIRSSAGDDAIDGGEGFDTGVINVGRSGLVVTSPADGVFVIRPTPGGLGGNFGIDTVTGVESFRIVSSTGTVTVSAGDMLARFNDGSGEAAAEGGDQSLVGAVAASGSDGDEAAPLATPEASPPKAFADEHEARATRLYDTVFDRVPDRPGLDF